MLRLTLAAGELETQMWLSDVAVRCGCQMAEEVSYVQESACTAPSLICIPDHPRTKNAQVAVWSGRTVAVFLEVVRKKKRLSASAGSQRPVDSQWTHQQDQQVST